MGKATGFLEYARVEPAKRSPGERMKDWGELRLSQPLPLIQQQGARCMNCGVPFCHGGVMLAGMVSGCPLNNLIPEWNELVYLGQWKEAYLRLTRTHPFPEFTSRVCPAPCEGSCTEGAILEPVAINSIEYEIIERAFKEGWVKVERGSETGKKVAVIGSGPSGLAAAHYLSVAGHQVTVYERSDRPGGLLMYGIPNMKLDKRVVLRRVELLEKAGVRFQTGVEVGQDVDSWELLKEYDAAIACIGATKARKLEVPGSDLSGIHLAVDYLKTNTRYVLDGAALGRPEIDARGKDVIILGGGDTGTDCVATALRQGCKSVKQFEIMPAPPEKREDASNPWPEWPKKLKTDYGQEEAILQYGADPRHYCLSTVALKDNGQGGVGAVDTMEVQWVKESSGRFLPKMMEGSLKSWKADLVLLAMGFLGPEDTLLQQWQLNRDGRSNIFAEEKEYRTNQEKIFAAGDARRGQSLVVWALKEGKEAAAAVDRYLANEKA